MLKSINFLQITNIMKIVTDDKIPFLKGVLEPFAEVVYIPGKEINSDSLKDADALLIRTRTLCSESLLSGTNIKFIGTATIGFDHIDTQFCEKNNITWANAPGCNSSSVQQYIAAALLKMATDFRINLKEKTIGIIGVGNVGSKIKKMAEILGMNVLLNDPPRAKREGDDKFTEFDKILSDSDIITVHVPLNIVGEDNTYHLFNEKTFGKMKRGSWFFNSSRGEVLETTALKKAFSTGKLDGAVLDVWENEPDIDIDLMGKAFIATPHIAGYSTDGKANGTAMVVNTLAKFFNLPMLNWYTKDVPQPLSPIITIDCKEKTDEDILREAVSSTYNITDDDLKLRFSPSDFEKQRGKYPLRREFSAYSVKLLNCSNKSQIALKELGFRINV
jgi:erythronate-4-phosphate dehydrogenase